MKIKNINSLAFTIIELIVASMIVGVVMVGIVTTNAALQRSSKSFASNYFLSQQTTNILNHIETAALYAIGTPLTPGIVGVDVWNVYSNGTLTSDPLTGVANTFCIHQNIDQSDTGWPGTEGVNKRWFCYTFANGAGTPPDYNIYWCKKPDVDPATIVTACPFDADHSIGMAYAVGTTFNLNSATGSQTASLEVVITSCFDNTQSCASGNPDNPYYQNRRTMVPYGQTSS